MITTALYVALGGALGAVLRWGVGMTLAFPMGTLMVNVAGSLVIGVVWVWFAARGLHGWMPFVMTGLLGGFTTFSAFSLDTMRLLQDGRILPAFTYVAASVVLSLLACALGLWLAKGFSA